MTTALTVDENANWRLYASHLPAGAVSRGTVQRPDGQTRALVRLASGVYVQCNAGAVRSLDQTAVAETLSGTETAVRTSSHD